MKINLINVCTSSQGITCWGNSGTKTLVSALNLLILLYIYLSIFLSILRYLILSFLLYIRAYSLFKISFKTLCDLYRKIPLLHSLRSDVLQKNEIIASYCTWPHWLIYFLYIYLATRLLYLACTNFSFAKRVNRLTFWLYEEVQ